MVHIHHPWWCISTTSNRDGFFFARQWAMMNRSINDKERKSGNDNKGEKVKKSTPVCNKQRRTSL
ncbi:hypothetical protein [Desulfogranum marinum]|uniref:hypothetical protein n=1 Tax=Desulfogranum marinum TaxID=453220 RepID=UPI0029C61BD6|nr:hypothetical protein [Desulfogranum marinum]